MGTYIHLSILPNNISEIEWEKVYEESLSLVKAFPFADIEEKDFFGYRVPVYLQAVEKAEPEKHWKITGDLDSKQFAETFSLYRDLNKYKTSLESEKERDILLEEGQEIFIFDSKTQGYHYHIYILAIAMLIESRFPKSALVSGDIDYHQCIKAKQWANQHLSLPIDLPVRVQMDKLLSRNSNLGNELEQIDFLEKWLITDSEKIFEIIYNNFSAESFQVWFSKKLRSFSSPNQLGALKLLIYYLNVTKNVNNLLHISCRDENRPNFPSNEIIRALTRTWICLPPEKFSFLKLFDKVDGHPQIIERQFGTIILDMKFTGREIKSYIPLQNVAKSLVRYFPELEDQIETTLRQEMSKIEEELSVFHNQIQSTIELSKASTKDRKYLADEDASLYFNNNSVVLTEEQDLLIKGIAYSIRILLNQEGEEILKQFIYGSIRNLKRILVGLLIGKFNILLTEQAWDWIYKTEDPRLVRVLVTKLILDDARRLKHEKAQSDIRKAMLENKALTQKIADYVDNEVAMKQVEKYMGHTD